MFKTNREVPAATGFFLIAIPHLAMATGGGEPAVSINQWSVIGLIAAICLGYKVLKK